MTTNIQFPKYQHPFQHKRDELADAIDGACAQADIIPDAHVHTNDDGMHIFFDLHDIAFVNEAMHKRCIRQSLRQHPFIGDMVLIDGRKHRIVHVWDDGCQTKKYGSFYLSKQGHVSHSGGLDPIKPMSQFSDTGRRDHASFWTFHHDAHRAHNSVYFQALVKVWMLYQAT